jgi:alpha-L-rhamnosidase
MKQVFISSEGNALGHLTGPWWLNNTAVDPEQEYPAQEAFFRIEFSAAPDLRLRLASAAFYQFWLNGHWMGCGPARASHGRLTVDEWKLPPEFLAATNTLAVQVFWEGIFTFDHVLGTPGLWFALLQGETALSPHLLATDATGRMATHRSSHQRGWIEEIDSRQRAAGWPTGPWRDAEWRQPVLRPNDPAVILESRDIKPFTRSPLRAESVSFVGSANRQERAKHRPFYYESAPGFEAPADAPARVMQEEALEPGQATDENVSALTASGSGVAVLGPDARGLDRSVQLDFGKLVTGTLELTLEAPAGTVIDLGWSEGRWEDSDMGVWARSAQPGGSAPSQEINDARQGMRYICAGGGVETFHGLFIASFQNLRLAFRSPDAKASLRVHDCRLFARGYPLVQEGAFRCSDASLNRIYAATLHTMACSIDDAYLDCPGRERGGYPNDSYWASLGFLDVTGDLAFDRRYLRQFIDSQEIMPLNGGIAPCYPSDSARWRGWPDRNVEYVITGHVIFWLIQCARHLRLSRDTALKEKWKPAFTKALASLQRFRSQEGLLENVPWDTFLDWSRFERAAIQTGDNFIYSLALTQLGRFYQNQDWIAQGSETAESVERLAWSPGRDLYADTITREKDGLRPGSAFSALTNYVALWSGLAGSAHAERAWRQLRHFHPVTMGRPLFDYETDFTRANLYGLMYRFGYQGQRGELNELTQDLREAYEPMFARGQSTLGEHLGYHGSLCHGYNGFVAHLLHRYLAGIELPENPGDVIRIRPRPDVLSWCQARTCWMGGHVQVWWSRSGNEVEVLASVPAGQKGELILERHVPVNFSGTLHTKIFT